jgi:hypothetical protein
VEWAAKPTILVKGTDKKFKKPWCRMYRSAAEEDNFPLVSLSIVSRGSSVSIVSGYGLDDLAIEIRSQAEAEEFSSILCVQTSSGAHSKWVPEILSPG